MKTCANIKNGPGKMDQERIIQTKEGWTIRQIRKTKRPETKDIKDTQNNSNLFPVLAP